MNTMRGASWLWKAGTCLVLAMFGMSLATAAPVRAEVDDATFYRQVTELRVLVRETIAAADAGDIAMARKRYQAYDESWDKYEDAVKDRSGDAYRSIEDAMDGVKAALGTPASPDKQKASDALRALARQISTFAGTLKAVPLDDATLTQQMGVLNGFVQGTFQALGSGDVAKARSQYGAFDDGWKKYEDGVRDRSRDFYRSIEDAMDGVKAALLTPAPGSVDKDKAGAALKALDQQMKSFGGWLQVRPAAGAPASLPRNGELPVSGSIVFIVGAGIGLLGLGSMLRRAASR